jgi:hypothetical protein
MTSTRKSTRCGAPAGAPGTDASQLPRTATVIGRLLRDPLFAFVLAGMALFLIHDRFATTDEPVVRLDSETRARLIADFEGRTRREAGSDDIARLEREYIADELLFREALDAGMHLGDGVVRARLVEEMRYRVTGLLPDPSEEQLVNHYAEHRERYLSEPSISFDHVYFEELDGTQAEAILQLLRRGEPVEGDAFWQGKSFPAYGESMIRSLFGPVFLQALKDAPAAQWTGPVASERGAHFLLRGEIHAPRLLPFEAVRQQVENDFLVLAIQRAVDARIEQLRDRYPVVVER